MLLTLTTTFFSSEPGSIERVGLPNHVGACARNAVDSTFTLSIRMDIIPKPEPSSGYTTNRNRLESMSFMVIDHLCLLLLIAMMNLVYLVLAVYRY